MDVNSRFSFTWIYLRLRRAPAGRAAVNLLPWMDFHYRAEALWTAPMYEIDCANKITATPSLTDGLTRYLFEQRCIRPHVNTLTSSFRPFLIREEKQHLATRREKRHPASQWRKVKKPNSKPALPFIGASQTHPHWVVYVVFWVD